jgi:hypothetical protein
LSEKVSNQERRIIKEPIIAENPLQNDFTFVLKETRIAATAVDAVLLSPAAVDRLLSDTNLQDPEILSGRVCGTSAIWSVQLRECRVILGYIQQINCPCLTRKYCGECSGVLR